MTLKRARILSRTTTTKRKARMMIMGITTLTTVKQRRAMMRAEEAMTVRSSCKLSMKASLTDLRLCAFVNRRNILIQDKTSYFEMVVFNHYMTVMTYTFLRIAVERWSTPRRDIVQLPSASLCSCQTTGPSASFGIQRSIKAIMSVFHAALPSHLVGPTEECDILPVGIIGALVVS